MVEVPLCEDSGICVVAMLASMKCYVALLLSLSHTFRSLSLSHVGVLVART